MLFCWTGYDICVMVTVALSSSTSHQSENLKWFEFLNRLTWARARMRVGQQKVLLLIFACLSSSQSTENKEIAQLGF